MSKLIVILQPLGYSNKEIKKDTLKVCPVSEIESNQLEQIQKVYKVFDFKTRKEIKSKKENGE
jgi:hypothetical protein